MQEHRPRKRFGQNFLHDAGIIRRIVAAIRPQNGQRLVEIGPGLGALTAPLLTAIGRLDVVELDRDLIPRLQQQLGDQGELQIHGADALRFDFCQLVRGDERLRVVGNLPYNISTPLLFHLLDQAHCIDDMHFMLQEEVVDRLCAAPGGKDYGRLSVMVQYQCAVEKLFTVPPGAFNPPPKVYSAIVRITPYRANPFPLVDVALLGRLVSQAFSQRRKTLRNTLRGLVDDAGFAACDVDPSRRPETLSVDEFVRLTTRLGEA